MLTYGSLFSGIGAFDLGFDRAGMTCAWQVEIDPTARAVLARHWPGVTRHEDVTHVGRHNLAPVDLICGGFPCQDVSVAGRRAGLAGERSGLWWEFHRIVSELAPRWVVIENVPGLLSSNGGRDMGAILGGLGQLGYGWAYRVLDAQWAGVPQRRRRVFIVGCLRAGRAVEVLFEPESVQRDTPPRREAGKVVAPILESGANRTGGTRPPGTTVDTAESLIAVTATGAGSWRAGLGPLASSDDNGTNHLVAFQQNQRDEVRLIGGDGQTAGSLAAEPGVHQQNYIASAITASAGHHGHSSPQGDGSDNLVVAFDWQKGDGGADKSFRGKSRSWVVRQGDYTGSLSSTKHDAVAIGVSLRGREGGGIPHDTYELMGYNTPKGGTPHAHAAEARSREVLRAVRQAAGEEAFQQWCLGVLARLPAPEVLRPDVHGAELRQPACEGRSELGDGTLARAEVDRARAVRAVWGAECLRRASQEWQLAGQLADELGAYLSRLSQPGAPRQAALHDLWEASEGLGLLRQALSAVQEVRRPADGEGQPAQPAYTVRRLTPKEAERLMGLPDGWTEGHADSHRYRMLGNGVVVNVAEWIGRRIARCT